VIRLTPKPDENVNGLPSELDDAIFEALKELLGRQLAHPATEVVCQVLASRRDALQDMQLESAPTWTREADPDA
jgi:hypothetical protein